MTDAPKDQIDIRLKRFLSDFYSLFPRFRSNWDSEQLQRLWFPQIKVLSLEEVEDVCDHFAFHWPDMTKPPGPRDLRKVIWDLRRRRGEVDEHPSSDVQKLPMSPETLERIEVMRRENGLPPMSDEMRRCYLDGTYLNDGEERQG